jgi:hypothetical protein
MPTIPMPVPDNTDPYTVNYPSFLDNMPDDMYLPPADIPAAYERYYETLAGVEQATREKFFQNSTVFISSTIP